MLRILGGLCLGLFVFLAGCSGEANSTPNALTPEQQRQMDAAQEKANAEEQARTR